MSDSLADARSALRWLDAFPWIEAAARDADTGDGSVGPWWQQAIDDPGSVLRNERLAMVSGLALGRLSRWPIGQIFPRVPAETVLACLPLTTRARNVFASLGWQVVGDLEGQELSDLLALPQVGVGTIDSILQALAGASTSAASLVLVPVEEAAAGPGKPDVDVAPEHELSSLGDALFVEDLRLIAGWCAAVGTPDRPLLGSELPSGTPSEIIKARQRLEMICAGDVLEPAAVELDAAELLQRAIGALAGRTREILARRFFADCPETLDELGRGMGLTRERVRQIEAQARADMVGFLRAGGNLELVGRSVRELVGDVLSLDALLAFVPALARQVGAVEQPAWRVLDRLDDAYEIEDGWCVAPTMLAAQTMTTTRLQELADAYGVVRIEDIGSLNAIQSAKDGRDSLREWLSYCGYHAFADGYVFTQTRSIGDRAASILSVVGSPMSLQEILERCWEERSPGSLRNAMSTDDRFDRVDRDRWALAEWGLESYTGIRALVRQEVARGGGQVAMADLIERITGKYSVSASSVVAYASAPPFEANGGIVRLAVTDRGVQKSPSRTRRLYRRDGDWLYRVKITKDHLRGSGSVAPGAIAGILGLQYGQTRLLESELEPQSIYWTGVQPGFGSIRRFLIAADIAIDSETFLVIAADGTFHTEVVETAVDALHQALAMVGARDAQSRREPRRALALAIGLPENSPAASVIGGYRERGDSDIAELLITVRDQLGDDPVLRPAPSTEIDEIMSLL